MRTIPVIPFRAAGRGAVKPPAAAAPAGDTGPLR
jgi:hypothetical protein